MHINLEAEREDIVKLCAWLRENSSGRYRPSAEAATIIELLVSEVDRLNEKMNLYSVEDPKADLSHSQQGTSEPVDGALSATSCRRCNSYATLVKSLESRLAGHTERAHQYAEATATLESERAANHALTEEVQRLNAELESKVGMIELSVKTLIDRAVAAIRAQRSILWWHPDGRPVYSDGEGADLVLRSDAIQAVQCLADSSPSERTSDTVSPGRQIHA